MTLSQRKCQRLFLLTGLISPIVFSASQPVSQSASQPVSHHNTSLKSSSNLLSKFPKAFKNSHVVFQLGGYWGTQGKQQHINIQGLIGDEFTVTDNHSSNGLVGLGYFLDGQEKELFKMTYGINAFYLAKASVSGRVIQENLFENLSYHYNVTYYPVYAVAKSTIQTKFQKYSFTVDTGIGPNFIKASGFRENSLDGGITIPDNAFSGRTSTTFSATAGVGVKINQAFGKAPLECGYRFFYLGKSNFNKNTNQLLNTLNTGNNYANAMICSITV